jgi:hypothetical protein
MDPDATKERARISLMRKHSFKRISNLLLMIGLSLFVNVVLNIWNLHERIIVTSCDTSSESFRDGVKGGITMKEWRDDFKRSCHQMLLSTSTFNQAAKDQKELLERAMMVKMKVNTKPSDSSNLDDSAHPYQRCKNAFIDLGTNIGDSLGYFIDTSIDICSPIWALKNPNAKVDANFPRPHVDVTTLEVTHHGSRPNPLVGILQHQTASIQESWESSLPTETFCLYGMEGNPAFTERLTKLENFILGMEPRPVQHVHIFKESVVSGVDGPTKLYLDKISVDHNVSCCLHFIFGWLTGLLLVLQPSQFSPLA